MVENSNSMIPASRLSWKLIFNSVLILLIAVSLSNCQIGRKGTGAPNTGPYRVIGYVSSRTDIRVIDPTKLTHINYAFAKIDEEGGLFFPKEQSVAHLTELVALKNRNPKLKIILSVGGWGADHFSDAALTSASRRQFAQNVVAFISQYNLDGVDLDWEYPGQPGPGIKYREEDRENFTLLLRSVREHLDARSEQQGRKYLLTIASSGSRRYFENTEMEAVHPYLDFVNVMTYDFYTGGSGTTGHHAGLYKSRYIEETERYADAAIQRHLDAGIPGEKIVLGVAFYGRGWTGVEPVDSGLYQSVERATKAYTYKDLQSEYINKRSFDRYWDDSAKAPYLWSTDSTTFISYEDPESLTHKVDFIKAKSLGGVMFWEYRHDDNGALLDTLLKGLEVE